MHFDLGSHVKSRSRSAQLEKTLMNMATLGSISFKDGKRSLRTLSASRSGNLPLVENTTITNIAHGQGESSVSGTSTPGSTRESIRETIRGSFRGSLRGGRAAMLEVEDMVPRLSPVRLMTYEELYVKPEPEPEPEPVPVPEVFDEPEAEESEEESEDEENEEGDDTVVQEEAPKPQVTFSSNGSAASPPPAAVAPATPSAVSESRNIVRRKLTGYVGFANLPNQWHRKSVRKGFNFNVMVVGESGLGKSTLVNTLFNTSLYPPKEPKGPSLDIIPKTVTIQSISADIEEAGVRLRLTVVDTPGFGDFVNNDESWRPIVDNIEQRFDAYLDAENKVNRMNIVDNRIHACVFFIQPTGHSLKPLDIEVMKRLHTKVNLIPVIAKSDTLTDEEITAFKRRILADIQHHKVQIFEGPRYELDDEETIAENNEILSKVPFAVVGATNEITNADGRKVRGRRYPWGVIEVDNEEHCDFVKLRQMLIRTHMEELKEHTNNILYENYRTDKLLQMGVSQDPSVFKEVNPAVKQEEERSLHDQKLAKMEAEMKLVFQQKVSEKESKLKQSEEELYARHREMKDQLERQRQELEEKKSRLESGRPLEKEGKRKGFSLR
ncbi:cell division control protein 3 [Ophiostoma piceae UAMH 11346]|uniref:Cell division control protein 3 n=1 Tax=Ophiostoma piceae (strain UAMH 11346) TaxID=1262450 RepID=S3C8I9_OPHP1|nr:cell division control protein 3 [Ophiostoma piceae UAMH 11346]